MLVNFLPLFSVDVQRPLKFFALFRPKAGNPSCPPRIVSLGLALGAAHVASAAFGQAFAANPSGLWWNAVLELAVFDVDQVVLVFA